MVSKVGRVWNILIASVGGQGGLTLSRVLAVASVMDGYSVRTGETLGMAQRFGSVLSFVRIGVGKGVRSPIFEVGEADILLGLEVIEALRAISYVKPGSGVVVVSREVKPPVSSSLGLEPNPSPDELIKTLSRVREQLRDLIIVPAKEIAIRIGNVRAANMVILGVLYGLLGLPSRASIVSAIKVTLRPSAVDSSIKAFNEGVKFAESLEGSTARLHT